MYDEAYHMWDKIKIDKDFGDDPEVTAMCFLEATYPKAHPIQEDDRQEFWDALSDYRHSSYQNGITLVPLSINRSCEKESFESFIGMDCPPPNWNEGFDAELTKDLHLTSAFHNIFFYMGFAITDFIYVRQFEKEAVSTCKCTARKVKEYFRKNTQKGYENLIFLSGDGLFFQQLC